MRTLVLAERRIDEDYYNEWRLRQQNAAVSLNDREDKLGVIYDEIECDLELVGVTAIEDKLQDGVQHAISNLQTAGIKIWVLTGDKEGTQFALDSLNDLVSCPRFSCTLLAIMFIAETAVNIGYSCQLLTDDMIDLFVVDGVTSDEVEKQLIKYQATIKDAHKYQPQSEFAVDII